MIAARPAHRRKPKRASSRWTVERIVDLFALPFPELLFRAQEVHRAHHAANTVQLSTLISIKTGGCPEDCGYCPQAKRHHTGVAEQALVDLDAVLAAARAAHAQGATRFCMGAAWRGPFLQSCPASLLRWRELLPRPVGIHGAIWAQRLSRGLQRLGKGKY
jgi:biotin synthase